MEMFMRFNPLNGSNFFPTYTLPTRIGGHMVSFNPLNGSNFFPTQLYPLPLFLWSLRQFQSPKRVKFLSN